MINNQIIDQRMFCSVQKSYLLILANLDLVKEDGETAPLFKSDNLAVTPCALANDGTSLKPATEFDSRL